MSFPSLEGPWRRPWEASVGTDEAVRALCRLGSPEDLSALLDASLRGVYSQLLDAALKHHLARHEGRPASDVPLPPDRAHVAELLEEGLRAAPGTGAAPASAPC